MTKNQIKELVKCFNRLNCFMKGLLWQPHIRNKDMIEEILKLNKSKCHKITAMEE